MRPIIIGANTPSSLEHFTIDWASLVTNVTPLDESAYPYLASIASYTNDDEVGGGRLALVIDYREDAEFDRLLSHIVYPNNLTRALGPAFLAQVPLERFSPGDATLEIVSPFLLEGTLADDLYHYGMYQHFYDKHSANEARAQTRAFLAAVVDDDLESLVPLTTREPWGPWFDVHSCSDRTWLVFSRRLRSALLMAFSHSD